MKDERSVLGRHAPPPWPTLLAAFLLAGALSVPVFLVLTVLGLVLGG